MRAIALALIALTVFAAGCNVKHGPRPPRSSPSLSLHLPSGSHSKPDTHPAPAPPRAADTPPAPPPVGPAAPPEEKVNEPASVSKAWLVTGYGRTESPGEDAVRQAKEDARADALRQAVKEVRAYLQEQYPDLDRSLTPAYLTRTGIARFVGTEEPVNDAGSEWKARVQLEMKPEQISELSDLARKDRMGPRQHDALLVLAGLCSMLGVAWAYLRLENATHGYSTGLLRAAALVLVALVLAGVVALW